MQNDPMQLDVWFNRITFFLKKEHNPEYEAETGKPCPPMIGTLSMKEFTFECADNQIVKTGERILYNLESRLWRYSDAYIYDVKTVLLDGRMLSVWFTLRNSEHKIVDVTKKVYVLNDKYLVNPIFSDYQPRRTAIERFGELGIDASSTEKFFRTFYLLSLEKVYNDNPSALEGRKPVHKALLDRLKTHVCKLWNVKKFAETYTADPICIMDQNLERRDREQDQVGNIVILLKRKTPIYGRIYDKYRW